MTPDRARDLRQEEIALTYRRLVISLQIIMVGGVGLALWEGQWLTASATALIVLATSVPLLFGRRLQSFVPLEFELLAALFIFVSLFLGEARGFYVRFWWWDIVLHATSGFLLGIVGFLLVYVLNEKEDIEVRMTPGFIALFAFMFAMSFGSLWEIFEFTMDGLAGTNMQKAMLGDSSGLTDTMWDLVLDSVGAATIAILGYTYLRTVNTDSLLGRWLTRFNDAHPGTLRRGA